MQIEFTFYLIRFNDSTTDCWYGEQGRRTYHPDDAKRYKTREWAQRTAQEFRNLSRARSFKAEVVEMTATGTTKE